MHSRCPKWWHSTLVFLVFISSFYPFRWTECATGKKKEEDTLLFYFFKKMCSTVKHSKPLIQVCKILYARRHVCAGVCLCVCVYAKNGNKHTTVSIELRLKTDLSTGLVRIHFGTLYIWYFVLNVHSESKWAARIWEGQREGEIVCWRERGRAGEKISARNGWDGEEAKERVRILRAASQQQQQ